MPKLDADLEMVVDILRGGGEEEVEDLDDQIEAVKALLTQRKHQPGQHDQGKHDPTKGTGGGAKDTQVRKALAKAFSGMGDELKPEDVKSIDYKRRKNVIIMEDAGGQLGNMRTTLNKDVASDMKVTLDEVESYLKANGAGKIAAAPKTPKRPQFSQYD